MLAKTARINRAAFKTLFQAKERHHGAFATAVVTRAVPFAVSVVVGKKVAKDAVTRNRLRRRVYGVIARFARESSGSFACIILLKPTAKSATRLELQADIEVLLARIQKSR